MAEAKSGDDSTYYEPLDILTIPVNTRNGIQSRVPAIHIGFIATKSYVYFKLPPSSTNDTGQDSLTAEEEEWLECAAFLEEDLHWVLKLPYNRFWSQVVYDEGLHRCLESYLSQAPRDYDLPNLHIKDALMNSLKNIHKFVFLVYLRMSTYKESKANHIQPEAFGSLIYDNFLFDVPKIMDLCVLYGFQNLAIVSKMVQNIFASQSNYHDDLNKTAQVVLEAFSTIEEKLSTNLLDLQSTSMGYQANGVNTRKQFTLSSFHDIINYVTDVSATLHAFLEVYSPACQTFFQNGAAIRIAIFYENSSSLIESEVSKRSEDGENERIMKEIKKKVMLSKTLLIKIFRNILNYSCIRKIIAAEPSKMTASTLFESSPCDQFLEIFTEIATEKNFLHDYNTLYHFETDLELFNELGLNLDQQRLSYILFSIHDNLDAVPEKFVSSASNGARPKLKKKADGHVKTLQETVNILRDDLSKENFDCAADEIRNPHRNGASEETIDSLIQSVLDVLPDLGGGFVEQCLQHLHHDPERVIDAVLTNSLPDHLIALDRNLKREIVPNTDGSSDYPLLSERKSIYDNDQFDLFRRDDVNMDNIHIGKKNKTPTNYEALNRDKESEFLKKLTIEYGTQSMEEEDLKMMYEDEYDDTYDSVMVGLKEPGPEGIIDNDPADEEVTSEPKRDTSKDFCVNPEVIRERAQQRREEKFAKRGGGPPPDQPRNRQVNDRNKAYVGNHNRRKGSDFKKSRGMMP